MADIDKVKKQIDPAKHEVFNKTKRPDKRVIEDVPGGKEGETRTKIEYKARIAFALQKYIVNIAAQFLFGNAVKILSNPDKSTIGEQLEAALKQVLSDNKEVAHNKKIAREAMYCMESAEHWYIVEDKVSHNRYGFSTNKKIRTSIWSPLKGDLLYPLFDDTGDMIAFSREFCKKEKGKNVKYFETYTSEERAVWKQVGSKWEEDEGFINPFGKIPITYARQEEIEYEDEQWIIERLEALASNHADTNDYHSAPKIAVSGKIVSFSAKGESGSIIEMEPSAKAEYLSWDNASDSVKLERDNLIEMLSTLSRTPKSFFESLDSKVGSTQTGVGLKLKFLPAHLKVEDKKEIYIEFLTRRYSIVNSILAVLNPKLKPAIDEVDFEPEITPYMIDDEQSLVDMLSTAYGGGKIASLETIVEYLGWTKDSKAEVEKIQEETVGGMDE